MKKQIAIILVFIFTIWNTNAQNVSKNICGIDIAQIFNNTLEQKSITITCDTIFSFLTKPFPSGLTWDSQNLWYVDSSYIYKVSTTGIYLDSIHNPGTEYYKDGGLTYDGINLWYADEQSAKLYKINPANGIIFQQFNLPSLGQGDPNGWGLAWDGTYIWHSQYNPPRLYKINPINGNVIDSLSTEIGIVGILMVNGILYGLGRHPLVNPSDFQIFKINTNSGTFQESASWCIPFSLGLTYDGTSFWNVSGSMPNGNQRIYKLNSDLILSVDKNINKNIAVHIFPNPTMSNITIQFDLKEMKNASLEIKNIIGQTFKIIENKAFSIGENKIDVDISEFSKGVYLVQLQIDNQVIRRQIIKL